MVIAVWGTETNKREGMDSTVSMVTTKQTQTSILPRVSPFAFEHSASYLQLSLPSNYDDIYMEIWT